MTSLPAPPTLPADAAIPPLLERHGPRIFALAQRLCGNRADAEDMVQDVFLQAYRKWHTFRGEADPGTWLYSIAARSCKGRMRRKGGTDRRMPAVSQLMPWRETSVAAIPVPAEDGEAAPVKASIRREAEEAVHRAILTLPEQFRVPLILKEMLELSIEQVGAALNIKPETVKTRVHRARLLLRQSMLKRLPRRSAPDPTYDKQVCLDLLKAKLEAMDHGRGFPIGQEVLCERCRLVFAELDLAQSACASMADGAMPAAVRRAILDAIRREKLNS